MYFHVKKNMDNLENCGKEFLAVYSLFETIQNTYETFFVLSLLQKLIRWSTLGGTFQRVFTTKNTSTVQNKIFAK